MKIKITTDSTCDLSGELVTKFNIGVMPLYVILGEETFIDGKIEPQKIYDYVSATGILPKTAAPSIEDFEEFFEAQLKGYDALIHLDISSKASSTYSYAVEASKKFGGKVHVVDSYALSTGLGLLTLKAHDYAEAGLSPEEIVKKLEEHKMHTNTSFVPDTLEYLHKGGRCSLAALMGAKVLRLHPMIDMKDGQMYAKRKYMGNIGRALKTYISDLAREYPNYDKTRCFITHTSCDGEVVESVKNQVKELFDFENIYETIAGCVVTSHCGKGTLGVLFIIE